MWNGEARNEEVCHHRYAYRCWIGQRDLHGAFGVGLIAHIRSLYAGCIRVRAKRYTNAFSVQWPPSSAVNEQELDVGSPSIVAQTEQHGQNQETTVANAHTHLLLDRL